MRNRSTAVAALSAVLLLTAACAEPPVETQQQAAQRLQDARDAEAATYAAEELRDARLALEEAELEVQTQNERFAIMRDYEEAEKKLAGAMQKADLARDAATTRKEEARQAAQEARELALAALDQADLAIAEAPRGKGTRADIAALTGDIEGVRTEMPALDALLTEEDYFGARDKAESMAETANAIAAEIQAAVEMQAKILAKRRNR